MELHTKRARSAVSPNSERLPLKRRALNTTVTSPPMVSRRRSFVPRISFLADKKCPNQSAASSSDEFDVPNTPTYHTNSAKRPAVHFKSSPSADSMLLEAVSKYSDTETDLCSDAHSNNECENSNEYAIREPAVSNASLEAQQIAENDYALERRKSLSRHASFSSISRKQSVPHSDSIAQERCFDYLLQSIDEVWARYCNTTSTAEVKVYDNMCKPQTQYSESPSPTIDDSCVVRSSNPSSPQCQRTLSFTSINKDSSNNNASDDDSDDSSGYKSEITNPTEYETDCDYRKISKLPDSVRLQSLKDRLCKAKNDLDGLHDSNSYEDCARFWRRWDMIKYSAVEMMEEDDDDEVIESVIEELERGRCFVN
ncbi:LANO_0G00452g1_1 [Lachancea nothofagi CBS 11611]|uniref:LANO_0G00452g1_1 n=1 Tax=Lachancea nothofagi CBS 11611 TaxID=1266666 RepID=A0A1G4KE67_9SACH|nr:LANO_0G00452g1_1 [Lachancea nothofagi CBS 11611]